MSSKSIYTQILAYVYKITHKDNNSFYIGSRYANIKLGIAPKDDILKKYFTSGKIKEQLKQTPELYNVEILFESNETILNPTTNKFEYVTYWYEQILIQENKNNPLMLNEVYVDPKIYSKMFLRAGIPNTKEHNSKISTAHINRTNEQKLDHRNKITKSISSRTESDKAITKEKQRIAALSSINLPENKEKATIARRNLPQHIKDEINNRISNSLMGNEISKETRLKLSEANIGKPKPEGFGENISLMKWYNNGEINIRSKIQPDRFVLGVCNTKKRSPETRAKSNGINKDKVTCYDITIGQFISVDKKDYALEKNVRYFSARSKQYKLLKLSEINSTPNIVE